MPPTIGDVIACPVETCTFKVKMREPGDLEPSPLVRPEDKRAVLLEALQRAATVEAERVARVLDEHGARDHEPEEFEAACQAVAAGLR